MLVLINKILKAKWAYIMLAPFALFFLIFLLVPLVLGVVYSFYDYNLTDISFVGFGNFKKIFSNTIFLMSIWTSVKLAIIVIPSVIVIALFVAAIIDRMNKNVQSFVKVCFYLPVVISPVALAISWKYIFNPTYGVLTNISKLFGTTPVNWFENINNAQIMIAIVLVSIFIGQPIILFSAAMAEIPVELYESAYTDGAGEAQKFFMITLPLLRNISLFVLVTTTIYSFNIFVIPFIMTGGGPTYGTTTVLYIIYNTAFEYGKLGLASAMGVVLFVIISVIAFLEFNFLKTD